MHPSWFKFEPGFRFLDEGGCECVVLSRAGYRDYDNPISISFHDGKQAISATGFQMEMKKGFVYACKYKDEWHLFDLYAADHGEEWWASLKPIES